MTYKVKVFIFNMWHVSYIFFFLWSRMMYLFLKYLCIWIKGLDFLIT